MALNTHYQVAKLKAYFQLFRKLLHVELQNFAKTADMYNGRLPVPQNDQKEQVVGNHPVQLHQLLHKAFAVLSPMSHLSLSGYQNM